MFRQRDLHESLEFAAFPALESTAASNAGTVSQLARYCPPSSVTTKVIILMNTKMILAAVALSLSLAACAKKEEPAEAAQDAAATATDAAGQAQDAAGDAAAAAGDAASAAGDAATPPAETPPAGDQPAEPPKQ
jgi:hypothetical protein